MPVGNARKARVLTAIRVSQRLALASALTIISANNLNTAVANGDTRTITMHHTHRGDDITVTFKRNGRYDDEALKKLNYFLRDWRTDDVTTMDPQLFDAVWEVAREFGPDKQINIISSYRSPRTNEMLRGRSASSGVARHSLHMQGKAMDFFIPGVPLDKIREAGLRLQRGGVGFYPTSGSPFVHMDVGNVRHWPRMTRDQLVRVFPNGRTVHLPTDGKPLAGFALAQADIERRASSPSAYEAARIASADSKKPNTLTRLFSSLGKKEPADGTPAAAAKPTQIAAAGTRDNLFAGMDTAAPLPAPAPVGVAASAPVPMPKSRPAAADRRMVAAAHPVAEPAEVSGTYTLAAASTPNDIILSRGYWHGLPETPDENSALRRRGPELASADHSTGSIGPFAAPPGYGEGKLRHASLSYASQTEPEMEPAPQRAKSAAIPRAAAIAANTTIASKAGPNAPTEVQSAPAMVTDAREIEQRRWDGPWMRALIMTPSVEHFMNTTLYGSQDFLSLRPMLQKPTEMVLMAFAPEPNSNLTHVRFEGRAIEFIATATFTPRTTAFR
ncbi:DUF882 domain-containing protein [Pseudorhodoplanes sinuspersici]|uniref:DUF882 domain-containing protein n=1 Tax=Pseudorhodoplanes sinuspersici TaxID=1235591 RepID=UPI000FEEF933|nr:DUF882 domain-containing protein [Pseudorhodoplanes sinuspersici]RKE74455.1 uncharacterized protein YcbK (DUF882 family) [Pseudorhodoplanes sinuspersici]